MLGLVAVDADGVALGVRGSYEIPRLLNLKIPAGAYFPLGDNPIGAYVRIGSDGKMGRSGEPVSLTVLPGLLDQKCWAYFMVEERELPSLGGNADFSFTGFSIGFGAGWGFKWGGGPIYLRASLTFLVGLGAIIGTLPDAGFSFNATGMLAVGFPDISVVFGIDAKFVSKPDGAPKEKRRCRLALARSSQRA